MGSYILQQKETASKEEENPETLYHKLRRAEKNDPLKFLPANNIRTFPRNGNEWIYGFTYRGTGIINLREDLHDEKRLETQIHESLHTPDEYETRRLTEWIIQSIEPEHEQYRTKPNGYTHKNL